MNCDDIVYIVQLQPSSDYAYWNLTTISKPQCFYGKLIAQFENDSKIQLLVFELASKKATIIIPKGWIKWMAPSEMHWKEDNDDDE